MAQPFFTPMLRGFVAAAYLRPAIWRVIVGGLLIAAANIAALLGLLLLADMLLPDVFDAIPDDDALSGNDRLTMAVFLLAFAGPLLAAFFAARFLHKRAIVTLFGPRNIVVRHFVIAVGVFLCVQVVPYGIWVTQYDAIPLQSVATTLIWLPFVLVLVALQTGTEEVVFRGYLLQQLAARFRNPIWWFLLPQVIFALLHFDPASSGRLTWVIVISIGFTGLMWADLVRITGSIGASWGWHFANNALVMTMLANQGSLMGFAAASTPYAVADTPVLFIALDIMAQIVTWLILRRLLRPAASR